MTIKYLKRESKMMRFLTLLLLLTLSSISTLVFAEQKCDDTGCYDKCTDNSGCSAPNGCYTMTAEDFEGSTWQSTLNSARRDNGKTCTKGSDWQCKSASCEWRCDEYKTDEHGNATSECKKDHHECADLKVCRRAQVGEALADSSRLCENGLITNANNVCIVASTIPFSEDGTVSTVSEVTIDPHSCAMKVPAGMNATYRYNIYMTQLLEFLFEDPQFGNDADCLGVTKGITYISKNLKNARQQFSEGIVQGLREQEEKFYAEIQNKVDVTKANSVDMYMQSLKAITENQKKYKEQNSKMLAGFQVAKDDLAKINDYYFGGFDWGSDATGDTVNRTRNYTLTDGWHAGVRDGVGQNYCRGRSPYMKNSWKRRFRQSATPIDLAYYLQLPVPPNNDSGWNQFWDSVGDTIKNEPQTMLFGPSTAVIHSLSNKYSGDIFLLDPVLPRNGVNGDYFAKFGQTDWTNTFDGDVRQLLDGSSTANTKSVNGMLNYYAGYLYKKFKDDPTVLGKIPDIDKPKINEIGAQMMNPDFAASLAPGFAKVEISENDAKRKYFIPADAQNHYYINISLKKYIDFALAKNFQENSVKHVVNFHKLMWDFRQRMYLIQYLYSANGGRRHPIQQRGTFFETFSSLLQYNVDYLNALNTGHDKAITCLDKLKVAYQEAVKADGVLVNPATNYNPNVKPSKTLVGDSTQYQNACVGNHCKESGVNSANLHIPTFKTNAGKDVAQGTMKDSNLKDAKLSAFDSAIKAIADGRRKNADNFNKQASAASKKVVDSHRQFIKASLSVPGVIYSTESNQLPGNSSSSSTDTAEVQNKPKATELKPVVPLNTLPHKAASAAPNQALKFLENDSGNKDVMPPEQAEMLLKEGKKEEYLDKDDDSIFTKISKGYMRVGLPRLLKQKAAVNEEDTEFHPEKAKKSPAK